MFIDAVLIFRSFIHQNGLDLFAHCLMRLSLEIVAVNKWQIKKIQKPPQMLNWLLPGCTVFQKEGLFYWTGSWKSTISFYILFLGRYAYGVLPFVRFMIALGRVTQELLRWVSVGMNHVGANCLGSLLITKARSEVEHVSFDAFT